MFHLRMSVSLPTTALRMPSTLRRMNVHLLLLACACILVWQIPRFQSLGYAPVMPLWLHTAMEVFSVSIAFLLFGVVWNVYSQDRSGSIVILGCAALGVAMLDLAHALSYKGMPDFITPSNPSKAINFWLAARALMGVALFSVAIRGSGPLAGRHTRYLVLGATIAATALIYWLALWHAPWWPETFIEGVGLMPAKIIAEWAIITVLAASALLLYRAALRERTYEAASFFGVAVASAMSELCFSRYVSVNDGINLLGHLLKIIAYLFLYRAAFIASVREPFRKLRFEVAERKRAEEALRQLNLSLEQRVAERTSQLEHMNRELEAFSYSVSHDLRAPLRAIEGFSQILVRNYQPQLDTRGKDYLGRVQKASERMGALIDDMLHLAQVSRQQVSREPVDITRLAGEVADELLQSDPGRKASFSIAPGLCMDADAKMIRIALENLMGNAWKFTAKKPEARIEIGMVKADGGPAVFVRDNGAGFNMEYCHKLFNAFQRLHSVHEFEGTGIGLATVQRIVQRHGGRAWAEGSEGEGATFYFSCGPRQGKLQHA